MPTAPNPVNLWELADLSTPWCVYVAATLRIPELAASGITSISDLAAAAGADRDSLHRVLRHLAGKGVFMEPSPGEFVLNDAAEQLQAMRSGFDLEGFGGRMAYAWGSLLTAVRTGAPAYHTVFGRPFWDDLQAHPDIAASFDELMGPAGHGPPDPEILVNGDWDSVHTVVDVGGGTGSLLAEVLRARPHVRGILVDFPATIARAAATFDAAGVADRVTTSGQSFFDPLPAGGDVYVLQRVLNDWPDREAVAILSRCAEAAGPSGRVVILEHLAGEEGDGPAPSLLMMVLVGGRDRYVSEWRELVRGAGLEVTAHGRRQDRRWVVECRLAAANKG